MLKLEATITASKDPETLNPDPIELFSFPIPGAGIEVAGIFKLGATVAYDVGTSATFAGTATADFGLEASLPDGAKVLADVNNPDQSSATGWAGSSLDPFFEVTKLEASITLAAYSQPKISFGITLDNVGDVDVVLGMKLPEISSTLSADYGKSVAEGASYSFYITFAITPFHLQIYHFTIIIKQQSCGLANHVNHQRLSRSLFQNGWRLQDRCTADKQGRHFPLPLHRSQSG